MKIRTGFVSNSSSSSFIISLNSLAHEQLISLLADTDKIAPANIEVVLDIAASNVIVETDNHADMLMCDYLRKLNISDYTIRSY